MSLQNDQFPILGTNDVVPWRMMMLHEARALTNHGGQSLQKLASRGGLSYAEACAVMEDRPWHPMTDEDARRDLAQHVAAFIAVAT